MAGSAERDACGIGFVADTGGRASRAIVEEALSALRRVRHRGAVAADERTGDGAGLLFPLPRSFLAWVAERHAVPEPPHRLGVAMCFLDGSPGPSGTRARWAARRLVEEACSREGIPVAAWRRVPVRPDALGEHARATAPWIEQALLQMAPGASTDEGERGCLRARKRATAAAASAGVRFYPASMSFRTVTYKALCAADQLASFYPDLEDPDVAAPFAMFHQRYSTNTAPTWERAQPFRVLCHNGEINTISGNADAMRARSGRLGLPGEDEELLQPLLDEDGSDSAMLDNALELLRWGGRDIRQAVTMLVPPAWESVDGMDPGLREFLRYHACLMEPWDGPAGLIFSDGVRVGAALDRNGLRPLRYAVCEDGLVACASEAGAVAVSGHGWVRRGKLGPGQMLCVDPAEGVQGDDRVKTELATGRPYGDWVRHHLVEGDVGQPAAHPPADLVARQVAFGFTKEEMTVVLRPMATQGAEPTSSMGDDTAAAALVDRPRPVTSFLKQRFAQVTNPPIDHLRERWTMSLMVRLGPRGSLLQEQPDAAAVLELPSFALFPTAVDALAAGPFPVVTLDATFPVRDGAAGLAPACQRLSDQAMEGVRSGAGILVISDGGIGEGRAPVPSVLAVGAVHGRLVREGLRTYVGVVADAGDIRESHDAACLVAYGADAVCPRTALETIAALAEEGRLGSGAPDAAEAMDRYRRALEDGVLKVMTKLGISTVDAYRGGGTFEALGLAGEVVDLCLGDTPSPIGGVGFEELGRGVLGLHRRAYRDGGGLESPGFIKHRTGGDYHATNPDVVDALQRVAADDDADVRAAHALQRAVRGDDREAYRRFSSLVHGRPPTEPRDLLDLRPSAEPIPLEEVESAEDIVRRFSGGAMSHGALSAEAHETLAVALGMIGARANSGEGGEARGRYRDHRNCGIKQVASGRFGVTAEYCAFADELQIKVAQGSKPGEGGQLPGAKVTHEIATLRHTPPGVALISPPPHHDIYSIEDLAQLVFDLKQVNPTADVSVKLVSTVGVGTIAAGVAKALADVVHVAGADGGTGASPLTSIKNAGLPWEIGLAETHRSLVEAGLRSRIRIRVDGGLKTGRDVVMAALLGADEFSFGTAALVALGCIMVRTCHRDTCPVGIASQRPELRAKFAGTPEMVARYLLLVAEEARELLARLGLRSVPAAVGRVDHLAAGGGRLDVSPLVSPVQAGGFPSTVPFQRPRSGLGDRLAREAFPAVAEGRIVELAYPIGNADRAVGARLGGSIARRFGPDRPPGRARARFDGSAGQSFGAFLTDGMELDLTGEANDYVGKAMSGGRIVIRPPADDAGDPVLLGNTVLYGATGGQLFCAGRAGERFGVRNSGAVAVVEGVGDHACEYMTGGAVVILGPVGRNMAAGMSGGEAYVFDPEEALAVNPQLVELRRPSAGQLPSLRRLVERHARATGSSRAEGILAAWDDLSPAFVRVVARAEVALIEGALEGTARAGA